MKQLLIVAVFMLPGIVSAGDKPSQSEIHDAVQKVDADMRNPQARQQMINHDKAAKDADAAAMGVVGKENADEMYGVSADILSQVMGNKSPEEMTKFLEEAQSNPQKFYESLPPDIQKKIHTLSEKSPRSPSTAPNHP